MVEATYAVIDVLEDVLASLAAYYPQGHFDTLNPRDYFSEVIPDAHQSGTGTWPNLMGTEKMAPSLTS